MSLTISPKGRGGEGRILRKGYDTNEEVSCTGSGIGHVPVLVACGSSDTKSDGAQDDTTADQTTQEVTADDIEDNMTSEDGTYEVAFVTDVGQLKDKSFNEGTWDGVKLYAYNNGLSYKYYQPANGSEATDNDRYDAMAAAAEAGAKVVVCAGYLQETALRRAATDYPDTKFVFIDGYAPQR